MTDVENIEAGSKDEAITKALERTKGQKGWSVLAADDSLTATRGLLVFRCLDARGTVLTDDNRPWPEEGLQEECFWVQWPLFDKPLEPVISVVDSAKELLEFAENYRDAVDCSDPKKLLLGFAHYAPERGHALICQAPLARIKNTPDQYKDAFLEMRAAKVKEAEVKREESNKEAAALGAAISNRAA